MTKKFLITGGAGFIGMNYISRLLERGEDVTIYDNLSRRGSDKNVQSLRQKYGNDSFQIVVDDVRNAEMVRRTAQDKEVIIHLAGQVAVTTSVIAKRRF